MIEKQRGRVVIMTRLWCRRPQVRTWVGSAWDWKFSLSTQQEMGTFFESGMDKAVKGERWVAPFICCVEDTMALSGTATRLRETYTFAFLGEAAKGFVALR